MTDFDYAFVGQLMEQLPLILEINEQEASGTAEQLVDFYRTNHKFFTTDSFELDEMIERFESYRKQNEVEL